MDIQQHARIARIKQFSRYLYVCLTWIRYFLWIIWPVASIAILVFREGYFTFNDVSIRAEDVTMLQRIWVVVLISIVLVLCLQLTFHFRELILHFSKGNIFNKSAIHHAQKSLWYGLLLYGLHVVLAITHWIYTVATDPSVNVKVDLSFVLTLMFFGLMYILLWALEIGCDLNEESELTI